VFIYTGILPVLKNQSGAAMVIGHEIGHVLAGHSFDTLLFMLPLTLLVSWYFGNWASESLQYLLNLPKSRKCELEADWIGCHMVAASCFDLEEAERVFQRLCEAVGGDQLDDSLSTHPTFGKRLDLINEVTKSHPVQCLAGGCPNQRFDWPGYSFLSQRPVRQLGRMSNEQLQKCFE